MTETIHLHIDRLIVDGVTLDRDAEHILQQSIQAELTRLITEGGLRRTGFSHHITRTTGQPIDTGHSTRPEQLGVRVARSIYEGMNR